MWKFVTGLSLETWLKIGIVAAFALLTWGYRQRGDEIDDLNYEIAAERASHEITRASVVTLELEVARQNDAIEAQRVATDLARSRLAQAEAASAGGETMIERLRASGGSVPAGDHCEPSEATKGIWR